MGYTLHEMNVILFSEKDAVFGTAVYSDNDNTWQDIDFGDGGDELDD